VPSLFLYIKEIIEDIWISHQALDYESGGVLDFIMGFFDIEWSLPAAT
jgi:hypothetical protein